MLRAAACLAVAWAALPACQMFGEKPPTQASPEPKRAELEPGSLPPEETPAPEESARPADPAEPAAIEPGLAPTGAPTRGKLPKGVIDEQLKQAQPGIAACYERGLKSNPELRGNVNVNFVVATDGSVAHVDAAEGEGALADLPTVQCILAEIEKLVFPRPAGGRVFVNYPLTLEPPKPQR